ncbi:MAG: hypothetical protein ACO1OQ_13115 [Rufibacter sp.]
MPISIPGVFILTVSANIKNEMKRLKLQLLLILGIALAACSGNQKEKRQSISLTDSEIIQLSNSILGNTREPEPTEKILKVFGSFTGKDKKELLVSVPYVYGRFPFVNLFLLEESEHKKWTFEGWAMDELTSFDTVDVDNDGIQEIKYHNASLATGGIYMEDIRIISIKDLKTDTLYKANSEDSFSAGPANELAKVGDTVVNMTKISFIDSKGSKVLKEDKELGIVTARITADSIQLKNQIIENQIYLKNKKYMR